MKNGDSAVFFFRQFRVQTLANVVHTTKSEDSTLRRTFFLSLVVFSTRTLEHFFNHACTRGSSLHKSLCFCDVCCGQPIAHQNTSSSLMSRRNLLGLYPESFTSLCSTPPQPPQTTCSTKLERASLTGIRTHSSATSLEGQSGYLADSIPLTGYEPKTCVLHLQKEQLQH